MFLKILLLGAARVGKSSLLARFCAAGRDGGSGGTGRSGGEFDPVYRPTLTPDFDGARVRLHSGAEAVLQIWDLPGNPAVLSDLPRPAAEYWRDAHVCVLVCDLCSKDSFLALEPLRAAFIAQATQRGQQQSVAFVLLINKAEPTHARKQQVFAADVLAWCAQHGIRHFYETSALADTNVLIALVNITQLAADCDLQRRGVKIACDAAELARQEARQAKEAADAAAKAAAEAEAARQAAEAKAEALRRAEQERLDAEARREADFEARWAAQRAEAEAIAARIEAEKQEKANRARERAEKRRAAVALSAYGAFKQRPHRLSAALIQKHAAAAEEALAIASGRPPSSAALAPITPVPESAPVHFSSAAATPSPPLLPRKPGSVPPSLHAPPRAVLISRPSTLGQGTGALLKRLEAGMSAAQRNGNASARTGGAVSARSNGRRPSTTAAQGKPGSLTLADESEDALAKPGPLSMPTPSPPGAGAPAGGRRRQHQRGQSFATSPTAATDDDAAALAADARELAALVAQSIEHDAAAEAQQDADPVTEALLDVVAPQVHFTCGELRRLHAPFAAAARTTAAVDEEEGLSYMQWKRSCWSLVSVRVPAWRALSERFFAAMDLRALGRVDFESFAVSLSALTGPSVDARAKLLFRVCDFAHVPFVPHPRPRTTAADAEPAKKEEAGDKDDSDEERKEKDNEEEDDDEDSDASSVAGRKQPSSPRQPSSSAAAPAPQGPVTKHTFLLKQQRELQGLERFPFDLYDLSTASDGPAPSGSSERFITRDCVTRALLAVLQALPSAQAALAAAPSASCALHDGPRSKLELMTSWRDVSRARVDAWWAQVGHAQSFCLSDMQWRDAVTRVPSIIQPFAPPRSSSSAVAAATSDDAAAADTDGADDVAAVAAKGSDDGADLDADFDLDELDSAAA